MAEPIAEAVIGLKYDEDGLDAQTAALAGKLAPAANKATESIDNVGASTETTHAGVRKLTGGVSAATEMLARGEASAGGMARALESLSGVGGQVGNIMQRAGVFAIAAFAGWNLGKVIVKKFMGGDEADAALVETTARYMTYLDNLGARLNQKISEMNLHQVELKVGRLQQAQDFLTRDLDAQQAQQVAMAEAEGKNKTTIAADYANVRANNAEDYARKEVAIQKEALARLETEFAQSQARIQQIRELNATPVKGKDATETASLESDRLKRLNDAAESERALTTTMEDETARRNARIGELEQKAKDARAAADTAALLEKKDALDRENELLIAAMESNGEVGDGARQYQEQIDRWTAIRAAEAQAKALTEPLTGVTKLDAKAAAAAKKSGEVNVSEGAASIWSHMQTSQDKVPAKLDVLHGDMLEFLKAIERDKFDQSRGSVYK